MYDKMIKNQTTGINSLSNFEKKPLSEGLIISIITVVFNGEQLLERTIKSVIHQAYQNIEYVIIDGGSTDNTIQIIEKYQKFISCWVSEPDKGIYDAMNKGISKCSGEYILFLNSGDSLVNRHIIEEVAEYMKTGETEILYGNIYRNFDNPDCLVSTEIRSDFELFTKTICHQAIFASKATFQDVGNFALNYMLCADREWLIKAVKKHNIKLQYINRPISIFDQSGVSSQQRLRRRYENMKINFIYFRWQFFNYLIRQISNKIKGLLKTHNKIVALL